SAKLRYTRFCKRVFLTKVNFGGSDAEGALSEINDYVKRLNIAMVVAGDQDSTHLLTLIQSRIATTCFPLPDAASYRMLYNKWEFLKMCQEQNVLHPESALFSDVASLTSALLSRTPACPMICKPLNLEAGNGILKVTKENALRQLQRIYYRP